MSDDYIVGIIVGAIWVAVRIIEFFVNKKGGKIDGCRDSEKIIEMLHNIITKQEIIKEKIEGCILSKK